jgi:eukaryotic-like serine/threonine-protein kinase
VAGDDEILSALAPLNADQTLGRYELLTPIGRGGMAVVWAARLQGSRGFSRMVAIKVMLPHLSVDPRFERMFLREAKIASRIRHPNVCEIADLGEQDGLLYLVMEWVDGDSLATVMRADGESLPHDVAAHIVAEAGRGLHAAHELTSDDGEHLDVVHRDVSPQNILVTTSGTVQIVDFGVAKAANDGEQTTQSGFTKGKVGYVAPEQVNGARVDARTDVFALGVVLYELTTHVHPFRGPTDLATLLAVASTDPLKDPREVDPAYPPELAAFVTRAV